MCQSDNLEELFERDYTIAMGCYCVDQDAECKFMPYNVFKCHACLTHQTKYLGDPNVIYGYNANFYGTVRSSMNELFSKFITENHDVNHIIEIGGGSGSLADMMIKSGCASYTVVDPTWSGKSKDVRVFRSFFEDVDITKVEADTLVMSHVFEHFYEPAKILDKISKTKSIKYVYLNFPDLEKALQIGNYHVLNPEHIFYTENGFIIDIFKKYGFTKRKIFYHMDHSVFFEFERTGEPDDTFIPRNNTADVDVRRFFDQIFKRVDEINSKVDTSDVPVYIWPCSMHTVFLAAFGLKTDRIVGVLDNSPHKIGRHLYGNKLYCSSFDEKARSSDPVVIILNGGCYNQEIDVNGNSKIKFI
jgi:hypothetical protein